MRRIRSTTCLAIGVLTGCLATRAAAQQSYLPPRPGGISPITQPVYSPYLNLLRSGGTTTQNYFGLVQPEFQLRGAAGNLQQQQFLTDQSLNNLAYGGGYGYGGAGYAPLVTGHVATFLNTRSHFLSLRGSGGYGAGYGGGGGYAGGGYGGGGYGAGGAGGYGAGPRSFGGNTGLSGYGGGVAPTAGGGGLGPAGGLRPGGGQAPGGFGGYPQ